MKQAGILDHAQDMLSLTHALARALDQALAEAPAALANGHQDAALDVPVLRQWRHTVRSHIEASPLPPRRSNSEQAMLRYAGYLLFLMQEILSDYRFVRGLDLYWSATWRARGRKHWEKLIAAASALRGSLPEQGRQAMLGALLMAAHAKDDETDSSREVP